MYTCISGPMIGTALSMSVSGYLCQSTLFGGWPSVFYVFGSLGVVWFIFWAALIHESPDVHPRITPEEKKHIQDSIGVNSRVSTGIAQELPTEYSISSAYEYEQLLSFSTR